MIVFNSERGPRSLRLAHLATGVGGAKLWSRTPPFPFVCFICLLPGSAVLRIQAEATPGAPPEARVVARGPRRSTPRAFGRGPQAETSRGPPLWSGRSSRRTPCGGPSVARPGPRGWKDVSGPCPDSSTWPCRASGGGPPVPRRQSRPAPVLLRASPGPSGAGARAGTFSPPGWRVGPSRRLSHAESLCTDRRPLNGWTPIHQFHPPAYAQRLRSVGLLADVERRVRLGGGTSLPPGRPPRGSSPKDLTGRAGGHFVRV